MAQNNLTHQLLPDSGVPALCVNLHADQIVSLTEELYESEAPQTAHLLADSDQIKSALYDFVTASKVADLVEQGHLKVRELGEPIQNAVIATDSKIILPVVGEHTVTSSDQDIAASLYSEFQDIFEKAESYKLRTPPISDATESLRENMGDHIADEFEEVLAHADEISNADGHLDIVEVTLLLAARDDALLYEISKWGEYENVASKATFSRTKTTLENAGLITTEKVPVDIGRPRLRLIASEEVADADLKTFSTDMASHSRS